MIATKTVTIEKIIDINIKEVTLLSLEEYEASKKRIASIGECIWWLRTPGINENDHSVMIVINTQVHKPGAFVDSEIIDVRPAIKFYDMQSSDLNIGESFQMAGYRWTVISKDIALCDDVIGNAKFREGEYCENANNYEDSDVKKFLKKWASENGIILKNGNAAI